MGVEIGVVVALGSSLVANLGSLWRQRGAFVMTLLGHVRSGRSTGLNGAYRWHGMPLGCWNFGG